jgi:hypothetical protein
MLAAMLRLGVEDVQEAAYAGSTASGIRCGRRAGARVVAGVLTGGHTRERLRAAGATDFITDISEFPGLLAETGPDTPDTEGSGAEASEGEAGAGLPGAGLPAARRPEADPFVPPQASASQIAPPRRVP